MTLLLEACLEMTTGRMFSNLGHMMAGFAVLWLFGQEDKHNYSPSLSETSGGVGEIVKVACEY